MIVLAFSSASISAEESSAMPELREAIAISIEAENAGFYRTLIEENTDFIVREVLSRESVTCIRPPHEVKQEVNSALSNYFNKIDKTELAKFENKTKEFLNANSSLVIKRLDKLCTLQYKFHGGLMKTNFISASVGKGTISQEFRIPQDYSRSVSAVAIT